MNAELTLDALAQALWARKVNGELIHHSDNGSQYLSIRYSERLSEVGIEASVGSVGDAYENAMAETGIGLSTAAVIWKHTGQGEIAKPLSGQRSNRCTGSRRSACLSRSATYPQPSLRSSTMLRRKGWP